MEGITIKKDYIIFDYMGANEHSIPIVDLQAQLPYINKYLKLCIAADKIEKQLCDVIADMRK